MDSMLNAVAVSDGDNTVKARITFEDESGNEVAFDREFELDVYEEVYEEPEFVDEPVESEPEANIGLIVGIAAAVVLVMGLILFLIIRKKKKKAAALKLEEDFLSSDKEDGKD